MLVDGVAAPVTDQPTAGRSVVFTVLTLAPVLPRTVEVRVVLGGQRSDALSLEVRCRRAEGGERRFVQRPQHPRLDLDLECGALGG